MTPVSKVRLMRPQAKDAGSHPSWKDFPLDLGERQPRQHRNSSPETPVLRFPASRTARETHACCSESPCLRSLVTAAT